MDAEARGRGGEVLQSVHAMARDPGLEELVQNALGEQAGRSGKAMFGRWAFLLRGHLLCGVSRKGLMLRVGRESAARALTLPGGSAMAMRGRPMHGYIRAAPQACADDVVRERLLDAAVAFNRLLAKK